MKKFIATFLISILTLSATSALAATSSPAPKPTAKTSAKPSAESSTKATKKPSAEKKSVKKKPVKKKKKKKLPPLQPVFCYGKNWPPSGFTQNGEVFAMIPTAAQLQCESSNNHAPSKVPLRADLKKCDDFACGAVAVASETGCTWWEVKSTFEQIDLKSGKILATLGTLRTVSQRTKPKDIQSIMLVSEIKHRDADGKVLNNIKASGLEVSCHHDAAPDLTQRNFFKSN
ncbi:MAG: hypothetical protein KA008_00815 [Candidatus Planktophila sp.]|nr:hypothetical protein [Candidatus Planktophila sp.]MBP7805470.1 hypothetical protein [Candidatus Planktophila sp.]